MRGGAARILKAAMGHFIWQELRFRLPIFITFDLCSIDQFTAATGNFKAARGIFLAFNAS